MPRRLCVGSIGLRGDQREHATVCPDPMNVMSATPLPRPVSSAPKPLRLRSVRKPPVAPALNEAWTEAAAPAAEEAATQRLDRLWHTQLSRLTGGLSPVSQALALADWAWHLILSPGRQLELAALAAQLAGG